MASKDPPEADRFGFKVERIYRGWKACSGRKASLGGFSYIPKKIVGAAFSRDYFF
jgi:hypothetical protein